MKQSRSIGLTPEVYLELLNTKHDFEKKEGKVLSYDEIIKRLIEISKENFGGDDGGGSD